MPCVEFMVGRASSPNGSRDALPPVAGDTAWAAFADRERLIGPGNVRVGFDSAQAIQLLIAVDVSGSMQGEGIAFTRSSLRRFIADMPSGRAKIAVVPFASRGVGSAFAAAKYESPSDALRQLDALPAPTNGNTALYSAVAEGLRTLDQGGDARTATMLILITDGVNDVGRRGDDPGLLAGESGREEARRLIASARPRVWIIGVGSGVAAGELVALAGATGRASVVAMDPGALVTLLSEIRLSFANQYTLTYGLPANLVARLGRRPLTFAVRGDSTLVARWTPPLLARPSLAGVADSALLSRELRMLASSAPSGGGERAIVGLALLAVLGLLYALLWRLGAEEGTARAVRPVEASVRDASTPRDGPSLRRDVTDAPPRSAQDVTNDAAV